jgi:nucleobindin
LEDIDQKRKEEFKTYEMEKEHLRRKELEELDANKRAEEEKRLNELKQKHANHPRVHHPVSVISFIFNIMKDIVLRKATD